MTATTFEMDHLKLVVDLHRLEQESPGRFGAALRLEGERILRVAKALTPVGIGPGGGHLRNSGFVSEPELDGEFVTVRIGFGGGVAEDYALAVHEHPSEHSPPSWQGKGFTSSSKHAKHPTEGVVTFHPAGTGPKFLERPMLDAESGMAARIADDLARFV